MAIFQHPHLQHSETIGNPTKIGTSNGPASRNFNNIQPLGSSERNHGLRSALMVVVGDMYGYRPPGPIFGSRIISQATNFQVLWTLAVFVSGSTRTVLPSPQKKPIRNCVKFIPEFRRKTSNHFSKGSKLKLRRFLGSCGSEPPGVLAVSCEQFVLAAISQGA